MKRFLRTVPQLILAPLLVMGMVTLILYLLGQAPDYIQGERHGLKEYDSIKKAETDIGFKLVIPTYFPSYLPWPPAKIYGQREPVPMVQALFLSQYESSEVMIISQIASNSEDLPVSLPWVETVRQKTPVSIGASKGVLITGVRADGQLLNGAYWRSGDFYFVVITTRSERELLTIVRSM
ncbi:hypothetical protein ACFLTR_01440 [Chloroflexota bacterium]